MHDLANAGAADDGGADVREALQDAGVVQYSIAKAFCGGGEVGPGVGENLLKIR